MQSNRPSTQDSRSSHLLHVDGLHASWKLVWSLKKKNYCRGLGALARGQATAGEKEGAVLFTKPVSDDSDIPPLAALALVSTALAA